MDWFLFDRDLRLERVNENELHGRRFSGKCPKCPEKLISQTTSDNRVCILFFSQYTTTAEIMLPQYLFYPTIGCSKSPINILKMHEIHLKFTIKTPE